MLGDHVVDLAEGWKLWRWFRLKSAGFPAASIQPLATSSLFAAIDEFLAQEEVVEASRARAIESCAGALEQSDGKAKNPFVAMLRRLRARQPALPPPPSSLEPDSELADRLSELADGESALESLRQNVKSTADAESLRVRAVLRDIARDGPFREALAWQNPDILRRAVDSLLRQPIGATDSRTREKERLLVMYLQRYCLKNDSIGFFGPVGWGALAPTSDVPTKLVAGPSLIASRKAYFEHWCIDALAEVLAADPRMQRHLAPRRLPGVWVEGTCLHFPTDKQAEIPPPVAQLLLRIDGETTPAKLAADPTLGPWDEEEVCEILEELSERRLITWTLEIPTGDSHPERALRRLLERLPDEELRRHVIAKLDLLESRRDAVAHARGDGELTLALANLDTTFREITGRAGTRRSGETYAARTLVYEDCRRDLELTIGRDVVDRLGPPLALILQSARWYTYTLAAKYRRTLTESYRMLRQETGSSSIDYLRFWNAVAPHFGSSQHAIPPIVAETVAALKAGWATLFGDVSGTRPIRLTSAELKRRVHDTFAAPHAGWPGARIHSPDIMIAARGTDALVRGEYTLVLGEIHPAANSLLPHFALDQHPDPQILLSAQEADIARSCISPVEAKAFATRADTMSRAKNDLHLEVGVTRSPRPREQVLSVGELVVEERDGRLLVRTRDERHRFDVIAFFEQYLLFGCVSHFDIAPSAKRTPRISIDDLVIARQKWRFSPDEIPFARHEDPVERSIAARRWARAEGLPRRVFVKIPEEVKPLYLDLESTTFVEIAAKLARKASALVFSEMLPSPDELWLTDREGRAYTGEIRLAAVDPEGWQP